ncbi:hypothetical protein CPB85DRAFT_1324113 [Mucidula mucida]|nr:hypothetical protein CPB85DRAFT_1324113 [Mucidula mucida]
MISESVTKGGVKQSGNHTTFEMKHEELPTAFFAYSWALVYFLGWVWTRRICRRAVATASV